MSPSSPLDSLVRGQPARGFGAAWLARVVVHSAGLHMKSQRTAWYTIVGVLVMPIAYLSVMRYLAGDRGLRWSQVIGSGMAGTWSSLFFYARGALLYDRWYGNLEPLLAAPAPLWAVMLGRVAAGALVGLLSLGTSVAAALLMGVSHAVALGWLVGSVIVFFFACLSLGLVIAVVYVVAPLPNGLTNAFQAGGLLLSGILFPVERLPEALRWLSAALPVSWAARLMAAADPSAGMEPARWWSCAGIALLVSALALVAAAWLYGLADRRLRRRGDSYG